MEYIKRFDSVGDVIPCLSCGYETETGEFGDDSPKEIRGTEKIKLCEVCANTPLSSPTIYPILYSGNEGKLFRSLAWIANKLIDEIRKNNR